MSAPAIASPGSIPREQAPVTPSPQDIANLAYALWQQRGSPEGSADEDWIRAERQLLTAPSRNIVETGPNTPSR